MTDYRKKATSFHVDKFLRIFWYFFPYNILINSKIQFSNRVRIRSKYN